jgi:hypothetical protein
MGCIRMKRVRLTTSFLIILVSTVMPLSLTYGCYDEFCEAGIAAGVVLEDRNLDDPVISSHKLLDFGSPSASLSIFYLVINFIEPGLVSFIHLNIPGATSLTLRC